MTEQERLAVRIGKFVALATFLAFIFLPQVGCGNIGFSGLDLAFNRFSEEPRSPSYPSGYSSYSSGYSSSSLSGRGSFFEDKASQSQIIALSWLIIMSSLAVCLSKRADWIVIFGISGILSIILLLLKIKGLPSADEVERELRALIEIKPGGFLTIIGFLATIFVGGWGMSKRRGISIHGNPGDSSVLAREDEVKSAEIAEIKKKIADFVLLIKKFCLVPYEVMEQKTNDRLIIFYGGCLTFLVMALNFLFKIRNLEYLSGASGFWLGLQFPVLVGGICWLILSYKKKFYPFDSKPSLSQKEDSKPIGVFGHHGTL